ncbi:katanin p80 WD40 repeat-containing subunit B1 [Nematolebias whitei]|uniref:katanin p80 WD40 repeat-containing subunit B1 n=1 Tax=Nematolebias whitei TaxID=451745 RepID=UPI00189B2719|nr:katanin p80 WD40 repeat-containing subunit B1 [Nematolebias whitei]
MEPRAAAFRRSYDRPITSCTSHRVSQRSEADRRSPEGERQSPNEDEVEEKHLSAEIHNAEQYKEIFQPKNAICRTPPRIPEPFPAPPEDENVKVIGRQPKDMIPPFPDKQKALPLAISTPIQRVEPTVVSCIKCPAPSSNPSPSCLPAPPTQINKAKPNQQPRIISSTRNEPIGLNVADFLPSAANHRAADLSDDEALTQIRKGHDTMCVMLSSRLKNLQMVRTVWAREDIKKALDSAVSINDLSIMVDVLNIINLQPSLWKLDLCMSILPQIDKLLQSKYER